MKGGCGRTGGCGLCAQRSYKWREGWWLRYCRYCSLASYKKEKYVVNAGEMLEKLGTHVDLWYIHTHNMLHLSLPASQSSYDKVMSPPLSLVDATVTVCFAALSNAWVLLCQMHEYLDICFKSISTKFVHYM